CYSVSELCVCDMLLSAPSRRDTDGRCSRDRAAADADAAERQRSVRERLEATVSGLGELEYLRQRQEVLVRAALELRESAAEEEEAERRREAQLSSEEKLLEENILLLRKQLNCLRRRDAGLITQLQELDRQISDLRLDTEASHDQLETDSRPSSGFYELSDGASGSLSNSSNSVFSECFCSMADADGRLPSTDELPSCLECDGLVGGLCDDFSSGTVRRSVSAPHPPTLDPVPLVASCDSQSKYHCDLVARNGSDVFRYPSPLHAVAVQSPVFLQMLSHGGHGRDEGLLKAIEAGVEGLRPESASVPAPLVPQSSSWPAPSSSSSQTPCHKRLDSYIYSLLQRRALPIRTSRPRTSISTDPSKSILRQASLCVRQVSGLSSGSGLGTLRLTELKPSWAAGGGSADGAATFSPQRQWSVESKGEDDLAPNQNSFPLTNGIQNDGFFTNKDTNTSTNSLMKKKNKGLLLPSAASTATLPKDARELGSPKANSTPKESKQPCYPPDQDLLLGSTPKNSHKHLPTDQTDEGDRSVPELASAGSSSPSQDEAGGDEGEGGGSHMVNAKYIPAQRQNIKLRKGGSKSIKTVKVKTSRASERSEPAERRGDKSHHRSSSKKSRLLEDGGSAHMKVSKRSPVGAPGVSSSRVNKRLPVSIPEGRVLDKHATSTLSSVRSGVSNHHHHHHHGRDQVVVIAKPKHKRNDYRRLRAIMEVPYDEAFRRAQRRQRKELLSHSPAGVYLPSGEQLSSPYSYVGGSDSEYSAECASLFHSTIVDTSEDERSNYTTNCFGDSESSEEEYVEESTTTSDTEESGGGGEMTPAQAKAFVKIKASHNLKKKILRFRSGSLKLMTTV
uniref:Dishevelled-binding antagonist of beta-catenin 1 n=1 Tax=Seriola dumerili TaxID=41447 RepID=A0A3B4T225_SERDU